MELQEIMSELDLIARKLEESEQWDLSKRVSRIFESLKNWRVIDADDEDII